MVGARDGRRWGPGRQDALPVLEPSALPSQGRAADALLQGRPVTGALVGDVQNFARRGGNLVDGGTTARRHSGPSSQQAHRAFRWADSLRIKYGARRLARAHGTDERSGQE